MKTNLSSQITLTRIPLKYYRPENAYDHSVLTRLEKIPTNIYESAEEGAFSIAKEIAMQIRKKQDAGLNYVIALPGGRSPLGLYKELIRLHKEENLSFKNVIAFVEYEFYPLASNAAGNIARIKEELLDRIDINPKNVLIAAALIVYIGVNVAAYIKDHPPRELTAEQREKIAEGQRLATRAAMMAGYVD